MGVASFPMDSMDAAVRVHKLASVLLYRVENATGKVASVGTAVLCRVRGVCDDKLGETAKRHYHRPDGSGWHSLCGSRLGGSRRLSGASGESDARSRRCGREDTPPPRS